ncbi:MAG: zf-HC2 domain-containing protein [Syntrophomonadaceae bacterium]|jgi:predicted anti-sigma-YlaC factor YlaD|nr:zf-HC2 domain-containing protein [Syntrophomonadaceae bacterium]
MDCHEAKNYISLYIDEEIADSMADQLLQHTEECAACRQLLLDMDYLSRLLEVAGQNITAAPDGFKDSIIQELGQNKGPLLEPILKIIQDGYKHLKSRFSRQD